MRRSLTAACLILLASAPACHRLTPEQRYAQGMERLQKNDLDGAIESFRRVLRAQPKNAAALEQLGGVLQRQGHLKEAAAQYEQATGAGAPSSNLLNNLGVLYQATGRPTDAVAVFHRALEQDPRMPILYYNLGMTLETLGRRSDAAQAYDQYLALTPNAGNASALQKKIEELRKPPVPAGPIIRFRTVPVPAPKPAQRRRR